MEKRAAPVGGKQFRIPWAIPVLVAAIIGAWIGGRNASSTPAATLARFEKHGLTPAILASIGLWVVLSIYWEIAKRNELTARETDASRGVHVALTGAAQILVLFPLSFFLPMRFLPLRPWITGLGLLIEVLGLGLAIWARRVLGRNWSGAIASNVDHELVRRGPYRSIRHPIYTGVLAMYLGAAIVMGRMHALVGLALALIAYARKIPMEEEHLRRHFGAAYEEYRKQSRSLIPGIF